MGLYSLLNDTVRVWGNMLAQEVLVVKKTEITGEVPEKTKFAESGFHFYILYLYTISREQCKA